ncbi:MAG: DUF3047 domain-containing protein [Pseudomonadota bacterium]|nr:DUF3047 domain-containing protein [Pseudomonadota bacterium]
MINFTGKAFHRKKRITLLLSVLVIAACTKPIRSTINSIGPMDIVGPAPGFLQNLIPVGWISQGSIKKGQMSIVKLDGIPALKVVSSSNNLITVKPSQALLLATPYLSWSWNMEPQGEGQHPVKLLVGFKNSKKQQQTWKTNFFISHNLIPNHERMLSFIWGDSALQRGTITKENPKKEGQLNASFTVRGGQENSNSWWFETVDLNDIYQRTWPRDEIDDLHITFIGISTSSSSKPIAGHISGLRLSR